MEGLKGLVGMKGKKVFKIYKNMENQKIKIKEINRYFFPLVFNFR